MISTLQQRMLALYALENQPDIEAFLVTDRTLANALSDQHLPDQRRESLLISITGDTCELGLFLDAALLETVQESAPLEKLSANALSAFLEVLEGISHFNYAAHRALNNRAASLFEFELQAEIDKFVVALSLAFEQKQHALARTLHQRIFESVSYCDTLSETEMTRYEDANYFAARYCRRLMPDAEGMTGIPKDELRNFFRMPAAEKISRITELGW